MRTRTALDRRQDRAHSDAMYRASVPVFCALLFLLRLAGPLEAQDRYDLATLLEWEWPGQVTLLHVGPLNGVLEPHYFKPAARRWTGQGGASLTGEMLRRRYGVGGRQPLAYALTAEDFEDLADFYGPMGGVARLAYLVGAVRHRRPGALLLWGGEAGPVADGLAPDVEIFQNAKPRSFSVEGIEIAAFTHLDGADPKALSQEVAMAREGGADTVLCLTALSVGGARLLAEAVPGIDFIFATGVPLPEPDRVGETLIFSSGMQGRFVTRLDFDLNEGELAWVTPRLIPVFAELIPEDPDMAQMIERLQRGNGDRQLGIAGATLSTEGQVGSGWGDLIGAALRAGLGVEVALVPALNAGRTVPEGQPVTEADLESVTRNQRAEIVKLRGQDIKARLEARAERLFGPDEGARWGERMVQVSGLSYRLDPQGGQGARILDLAQENGTPLSDDQSYTVAIIGAKGEPIAPAVADYIAKRGRVGQGLQASIQVLPE
ncbi:MAG: bifunctional metallophosphatase/5'-nucleotidase [Sulfitobacter sp.]|nr:bifunctional metallophosphatase/5'-nucleotidase [Sulfitobacter sp.]